MHFRSRFYFLTTTDVDMIGDHFFKPFEQSVWLCIALAIILVSIGLKVILNWDRVCQGGSTFLTTVGVFCQQGKPISHFC